MALKAAGAGTWFWRFDDDTLYWDGRMHEIFGTDPDTFTGHVGFFYNALDPCDRGRIGGIVQTCRVDEADYSAVFKSAAGRLISAHGQATSKYMTGICLPYNDPT
jgi:hypothetical protein